MVRGRHFLQADFSGQGFEKSLDIDVAADRKSNLDQAVLLVQGPCERQPVVAFQDKSQIPDFGALQPEVAFMQD